jgi:tetratricopeptide (TPR) repeat protein/uncharacterized caspase-like protein
MKKITGFSLLLLLLAVSGYCQNHLLAKRKHKTDRPKTWGLIIGISQYENIPGVKYADNDAEAFYNFWVNAAGGPRISPDRVRLLLNDSARTSEIYGSLEWLRRSVKKNDVVVIYFSGHGDGTRESGDNQGYLLAANASGRNYFNGTIAVNYLRKFINSYINVNKVGKVLLFIDACGSGVISAQNDGLTQTRLALQNYQSHVVSVLSAQKNEVSYSSSMWGKGHSVFSWYLLKGLRGLADHNSDKRLTADELANYLALTVPAATGNTQHPVVSGDRHEVIEWLNSSVNDSSLSIAPDTVLGPGVLGSGIEQKLDTDIVKKYREFLIAIKKHRLTWGISESDTINTACNIYERLLKSPRASALYPSLRAGLLTALLSGPEQFLDQYVAGKKIAPHGTNQDADLDYLGKMVSPSDILYGYVMARYYFTKSTTLKDLHERITMTQRSLSFEHEAPYALEYLAESYELLEMPDSAMYYFKRGIAAAPKWAELYNQVGLLYENLKDEEMALKYYESAIRVDSTSADAYNNLGEYYQERKAYDTAIIYHKKAIKFNGLVRTRMENQNFFIMYGGLAEDYYFSRDYEHALENYLKAFSYDSTSVKLCSNLGGMYMIMGDFANAMVYLGKAIRVDSTYTDAWYNLGVIHSALKQYDDAINDYKKVIALNPHKMDCYLFLGYNLVANGNMDEGKKQLLKATDSNPPDAASWYLMARSWSLANEQDKALACLKTAFDKGWNNYDQIIGDEALAEVRANPGFTSLMKKYFPGK